MDALIILLIKLLDLYLIVTKAHIKRRFILSSNDGSIFICYFNLFICTFAVIIKILN